MLIAAIEKAVEVVAEEVARKAVQEGAKIIKLLDIPLNAAELAAEIKEAGFKGADAADKLKELDKPLNGSNVFRMLDDGQKAELKENTKWSDKAIDGCKANDEGVIKYPCRNENLAGETNELTGVKYEKQTIDVYDYKVEVVMPEFEAAFEAELPEHLIEASDREQFKECNKQLSDALKENPDLAKKFTPEQLEQIEDGVTRGGAPDGYTWHHDAEVGSMQLVDSDLHGDSRHTGGKAIWGGGADFR